MIVAIIPARGGSKGIPRKNLKIVGGKTLLARAIDTCHQSVDNVVVSTEDGEVADEAIRCGATVHHRPAMLARDDVPSWPVIQDAAEFVEADVIVRVQCTSPFMAVEDIEGAVELLGSCDVAVVCHRSHAVLLDESCSPINITWPNKVRHLKEPQYQLSGSAIAFRKSQTQCADQYDGKVGIHVAKHPMLLDIDTPWDLLLAQRLFAASDYHMWGNARTGLEVGSSC